MASKKFQITLSEKTMEVLEKICEEKGLKKSVVIALAIEEFSKKGVAHEDK